jgi:hypothetical protein
VLLLFLQYLLIFLGCLAESFTSNTGIVINAGTLQSRGPAMVLRFSLSFVTIAFAFTLLSWGQAEPHPIWIRNPYDPVELPLHLLWHGLFGAMVALPTCRLRFIVTRACLQTLKG